MNILRNWLKIRILYVQRLTTKKDKKQNNKKSKTLAVPNKACSEAIAAAIETGVVAACKTPPI
uniref:Uncharacterized protein n=1 Tax=Romanomermis culicivorax TaxID=13658 RepID=A0A915L891_ROMCU